MGNKYLKVRSKILDSSRVQLKFEVNIQAWTTGFT